jgi:cysteine-rich repeat protein
LNTIFNSAINGCTCPTGFYMDSFGVCQRLVLRQVSCPDGQYFDSTNGCTPCGSSCRTCRSATQCITCATAGFSANAQGICSPVCGDGIVAGTESCDTGNSTSAGCVSCRIQSGFTCAGQPSVCRSTAPAPSASNNTAGAPSRSNTTSAPSAPSVPNAPVAPGGAPALSQVGNANINSNNVFITLQTGQTFTFANPTEMQGFIQTSFPSGPKPTVYCAQRNSPNLNLFDCLLIYPSGVPNARFDVNFSFSYQGRTGSTRVSVNPLNGRSNNRNRGGA